MTDFTNLRTALDNLIAEVAVATKDIIADANSLRREYLGIQERMHENRIDLINFADIVGHTSDCLDVLAGDALDVADLVADVLLEGEAPTCNYEDFVDYCDACGDTIAKGDDYTKDGDGYLCHSCSTVDGEQMELPIDETHVEINA
jgi:hypothetical protein